MSYQPYIYIVVTQHHNNKDSKEVCMKEHCVPGFKFLMTIGFLFSLSSIVLSKGEQQLFKDNITYARLGETDIDDIYNSLVGQQPTIYQDDYYASVYFNNLKSNFGNNAYGSCSYVSIGMLLSFYDSYWNDDFIPEQYDIKAYFQSTLQQYADFELPPFDVDSPGIMFESNSLIGNLTLSEYLDVVNQNSNSYFQFKLIQLGKTLFGNEKFDTTFNPLGMTHSDLVSFLNYYLFTYRSMPSNSVVVSSNNGTSSAVRNFAISKIQDGIPVILRAKKPGSSTDGHAFVAYDYDDVNNEIYVHAGWRDEPADTALTHVSLSDLGYTDLWDATSIEPQTSYALPMNYQSSSGTSVCSYNYIFPQDAELVSGNYVDTVPTFKWKSLSKEKWSIQRAPYYKFSILKSNRQTVFTDTPRSREFTLNSSQWENAIFNTPGNSYYVYLELTSDTYPYWDDYWSIKLFSKTQAYINASTILPNDYDFADAYPTDSNTMNNYVSHNVDGLSFQTRRYRTGYIQGEYIVLSPIKTGITEAFIEYQFLEPVGRIDVQLTHWREYTNEWLDKNSEIAELQIKNSANQWIKEFDLLADSTALPRNRTTPTLYKIEFSVPATNFRFYAKINNPAASSSNRGRICIGDLSVFSANLPTSGYEINYEPNTWNNFSVGSYNCYAYSLNTKEYGSMQPGQSIGHTSYDWTNEEITNPNIIIDYVFADSINYGFTFISVGKYTVCPSGTYKVALVIDNQHNFFDIYGYGYHWYRQNPDGTWSHKPGSTNVINTDCSGDIICNPETCDRNFGLGLNYNLFVGYFAVTPLS